MRRREFITLFGGATAAWPLHVSAQQSERMRLVAVLMGTADDDVGRPRYEAFRRQLQAFGWTEKNCKIEVRFAAANNARIGALAKELVALKPDLLIAGATFSMRALRQETKTI